MKTIKLAALLSIFALASWLGTPRLAFGAPLCDTLHGSFCSAPGSKTSCTTSDNWPSTCTCTTGFRWRCLL